MVGFRGKSGDHFGDTVDGRCQSHQDSSWGCNMLFQVETVLSTVFPMQSVLEFKNQFLLLCELLVEACELDCRCFCGKVCVPDIDSQVAI